MELLIRRGQTGSKYTLWIKFELTPEEKRIADHKKLGKIVLVPSDRVGDILRSIVFAVPLAIIPGAILHNALGVEILQSFFAPLSLIALLIYGKLNNRLTILDLLEGHTFKEKNVALVAKIEEQVTEWAKLFKGHLEASHTWGGTESVNL